MAADIKRPDTGLQKLRRHSKVPGDRKIAFAKWIGIYDARVGNAEIRGGARRGKEYRGFRRKSQGRRVRLNGAISGKTVI
ncbi:hypothetical protein EDC14_101327 [Hydrogenispora ethanolica]|uniref:Uncharacterized protein n=1 Tax=Hydrogenispora ethanolica TaxID=1082276 RepID=A0A4V2QEL1_HYDET|nr:hypothetical protein EDC14_101327 [Hydrogenispora ethanolica]